MPDRICKWCKYETDMEAMLMEDNGRPKLGDINICLRCGVVGVYDPDMQIRPMNRKERQEFWSDRENIILFQAWVQMVRKDGGVPDDN